MPESCRIGIEASGCFTALGDAPSTCSALLRGEIALEATPLLGSGGGDPVPLALSGTLDERVPPRWQSELDRLWALVPEAPWGSSEYPVYLTSSNFDVGSLYAFRQSGDRRFLHLGMPSKCLGYLRDRYAWGSNAVALSHACVTAQLGIEMASRRLEKGLAKKALVFSFDFISPFVAGGFHALKILNDGFPAPYTEAPFGSIGLGDGCGFAVLSKADTPVRIEGNWLFNEMHHYTANDPSGSGFREMVDGLKALAKGRPVWIKGHGTGTLDAGRLEATAFAGGFPESPLVSWKGSLGHSLGSCGIVELALAVEAIRRGQIPGTLGAGESLMASNVAREPFQASDFEVAGLFSNAFGGAHAGTLLSYAS